MHVNKSAGYILRSSHGWGFLWLIDTSAKGQAATDANASETTLESRGAPKSPGRRRFIAGLGAATAAVSSGVLAPLVATSSANARETADLSTQSDFSAARAGNGLPAGVSHNRLVQAFSIRVGEATQDALVGPAVNINNGDPLLYEDQGGTYTKGLPHDNFGRVDLQAFGTLLDALNSGKFSDFQKIIVGGTRTLNGPQGGLAFDLEALDAVQFGQPQVPPAPKTASDQNATELLEHYWASLLRDVAFTDYGSSSVAVAAAAELGATADLFWTQEQYAAT